MNKITIERTFKAPIEKIWQAFTNQAMLQQWWTPPGMTNCLATIDLQEGGLFRYGFKNSTDGKEYYGRGKYQKIDAPNYLSYLDCFTDKDGNDVPGSYYGAYGEAGDTIMETLAEFFFTADGETTTVKLVGDNPYDDNMAEMTTQGWNGMFDNLEKIL